MRISSTANPTIKQIRQLRQRKYRDQTSNCFVEGIRIVAEAWQMGASIECMVIAPELLVSAFAWDLVEQYRAQNGRCIEVTATVFRWLSFKEGPQGIGAVVHQQWLPLEAVQLLPQQSWVVLSTIQDPGNLGSILRTCDATGNTGVLLLNQATDPYDPGAIRASMGALFTQHLVRTDLQHFTRWQVMQQALLVGTSGDARQDYQAVSYRSPVLLWMGSEREGLSPEEQALCDVVVSIPMVGRVDSLNLAVATSVMLYEILNQRRRATD
ncbi:MAG: RNA methyltransferase [Chloroflexaceae bacterium]|nr:RNA methyltransferase [Chloroflexaceae bacterium]